MKKNKLLKIVLLSTLTLYPLLLDAALPQIINFVKHNNLPLQRETILFYQTGDINGDGFIDFVLADEEEVIAYLNDGKGIFSYCATIFTKKGLDAIALFDVDGDGYRDVIVSKGKGYILKNNGAGKFVEMKNLQIKKLQGEKMLFGDIDGDGDIDLFDAKNEAFVYLNDGKGQFAKSEKTQLPNKLHDGKYSKLIDFDRDGDLDIICTPNETRTIECFLNDGKGVFTNSGNGPLLDKEESSKSNWCDYLAVDIDNDKDFDLVSWRRAEVDIYVNNGSGKFIISKKSFNIKNIIKEKSKGYINNLVCLDLNGDANKDIVLSRFSTEVRGNTEYTYYYKPQIYLGLPVGYLPIPPTEFEIQDALILPLDFDNDGDTDLVFVGKSPKTDTWARVYCNTNKNAIQPSKVTEGNK